MSKNNSIRRYVVFTLETSTVVSALYKTLKDANAAMQQLNDAVGYDKYAAGSADYVPGSAPAQLVYAAGVQSGRIEFPADSPPRCCSGKSVTDKGAKSERVVAHH